MCEVVLLIEQRVVAVTLAIRDPGGWITRRLTDPGERLILSAAGLDCRVVDLYARTSLARARRTA